MLTLTSELTGSKLDYAVAQAMQMPVRIENRRVICGRNWNEGSSVFGPSRQWHQGGPIIEREGIWVSKLSLWRGSKPDGAFAEGPTPLVAAMRCIVMLKLGREVDIPEDLS